MLLSRFSVTFLFFCLFLGLCAIGGGSSWPQSASLLYLRPAAIIAACVPIAVGIVRWGEVRPVLISLIAAAIVTALQLIPLPPGIWQALPGHAPYAMAGVLIERPEIWRPISVSPDLTWNALIALVIPLSAIISFAGIRVSEQNRLVSALIFVSLLSGILGIVQIIGGEQSVAYFYAHSSRDLPVGLFTNHNHQALMLALTFPLLGTWATISERDGSRSKTRRLIIAGGLVPVILPLILITGSRAGSVLALPALIFGIFLSPMRLSWRDRRTWIVILGAIIIVSLLAILTAVSGRAVALARLVGMVGSESDLRLRTLPTMLTITRDFFPFGFGLGAFDPVFRQYEPASLLKLTFYNHAHSDPLEVLMAGGVAAFAVLVGFFAWWIWTAWRLIMASEGRSNLAYGKLGVAITTLLMAGSVIDYPLRTPLLGVVMVIGLGWMARWHAACDRPSSR